MSLFLSLVLLQLILFGILVVFLRVILTKNISKATAHINELNQDYSKKLEDAQSRVKEADKYYDAMLLKAKTEAETIKMQILKEAGESQQSIVSQSRKQSEEIIEKAQKSKETLLGEVEKMIWDGSVKKGCDLVQEILPGLITKDMHQSWIEELSKYGLEALDRLNISSEIKEAQIISAYELSPSQKSGVEKKITGKLGREFHFIHKIDPGLIAGIRISIGSIVIDGSLQFKIKEASRHA